MNFILILLARSTPNERAAEDFSAALLIYHACMKVVQKRGGSVCMNSFRAADKRISLFEFYFFEFYSF